jgi:lipoprotein-releasing system permease protein
MLKLLLCIRYLTRRKIVFLSILAVAISTALLVGVSSLFKGFIYAVENSMTTHLGDVLITSPDPSILILDSDKLCSHLEQLGIVKRATPVISTEGLMLLGKGNVRRTIVWGIDLESRVQALGFNEFLVRQKDSPNPSFDPDSSGTQGGFVGIGLAMSPDPATDEYKTQDLENLYGRKLVLMTAVQEPYRMTGEPRKSGFENLKRINIPFTVSDAVFCGVHRFDSEYAFLPIEMLAEKLYPGFRDRMPAEIIHIKMSSSAKVTGRDIEQIRESFSRFAAAQLNWPDMWISYTPITSSVDMQSRLIEEYRKQMDVLMIVFGIISGGVILLITCIFYMIVINRRKDIAVIRSFGLSRSGVAGIFIAFGITVGVLGSALGLLLGWLFVENVNHIERGIQQAFGLKIWKSSVYMFERIPDQVEWKLAFILAAAAVGSAVIGSLLPAILAAMVNPVKVLRYE